MPYTTKHCAWHPNKTPSAPPSALLCRYGRMARATQTHQIIRRVGAAFGQRTDVVNLLHGSMSAVFQALFAQRMLGHIFGADALPVASIPFPGGWVALVFFVMLVGQLLVRRTVFSVCKFRAAGINTGFLGFIPAWNSPPGIAKAPTDSSPQGLCDNCDSITIPHMATVKQ